MRDRPANAGEDTTALKWCPSPRDVALRARNRGLDAGLQLFRRGGGGTRCTWEA